MRLFLNLRSLRGFYESHSKGRVKRCINNISLSFFNRGNSNSNISFNRVSGRFNNFLEGIRFNIILKVLFNECTPDEGFKNLIFKSFRSGYLVYGLFRSFCKNTSEINSFLFFLVNMVFYKFDRYISVSRFKSYFGGPILLKYFRCIDDFFIIVKEGSYILIKLLRLDIIKFFRLELGGFISFYNLKII